MRLPKYQKHKGKDKTHICAEPGCGKEFLGHVIAKYCEIHHDIRNRKKRRKKHEEPNIKNQIFKHNYSQVTDIQCTCALEGCRKQFMVKIYPKQTVYPKYCEDHRQEYKRFTFLRSRKNEP